MLSQDAYGSGTQRLAADERLPGARPRGRPPRRDAGRDRRRCIDAYTQAGRRRRPALVARDRLRLPRRRGGRGAGRSSQAGTGAASDLLITPERQVAAGSGLVDRRPARDEAARQPPRRDLPRRPLQRQQRARRRLHDQPAHDRPRRVDGGPRQRDRLQRRLPRRLQPRRRRRDAGRDPAARLGAGVRAQAGDARRRHRLPVRRHRLPRVQRAALPQLRARAARRHGRRVASARRWSRRSSTTSRPRRTSAACTRRRCSRRRSSACRCSA